MKSQLLDERDGQRTFALVFCTDDEVISSLVAFAKRERLSASHFTAIGAFRHVVVAYFDWTTKDYRHIPLAEQVEVLSLSGDITSRDGEPTVHAHVVVAKQDASAHGGHLIEARVRPTLEVVLIEEPAYLRRQFDDQSGLALIQLD
jgi:uncharacterized protein